MASNKKDLIYFVVGGHPDYMKLLEYCIHSIRCYPENSDYDILVMCDKDYEQHIRHLPITHIFTTGFNPATNLVSMRKLEVFNFPCINDYNKVLFLDCDIVIGGSLEHVFDSIDDPGRLHVYCENTEISSHESSFFSLLTYDSQDLEAFERNGIHVFNTGHFGFHVTAEMREHFNNVMSSIEKHTDHPFMYEQPFMNVYFNRLQITKNSLQGFVSFHIVCDGMTAIPHHNTINHFANAYAGHEEKLCYMKACHEMRTASALVSVFDTRLEMHNLFKLREKPRILEIGSFKGDFAAYLSEAFDPSTLYIVDPWQGNIMSGDQDGNNVETYDGERLATGVAERFSKDPRVQVRRKFSYDLSPEDISHEALDMVYIDGDHSYEGVRRDLGIAWNMVCYGGFICGHDYMMNPAKAKHHYDFGVKRAVDEFVKERGLRIWALMMDGCVSFCIRK